MMIACKMHETTPPDVKDFCYISASTYSKQQVIEMEYKISSLLAFNFHIITPHHFVNIFLRAHYVSGHGAGTKPACSLSYEDNMKHLVDYLLEIASLTYSFVKEPPSKVAAAAIYLARATLGIRDASTLDAEEGTQGFFSRTLEYYSGYEESDLKPLVIKLRFAHKDSESANLHSVYDKYSKKAFNMVAHLVPVAMEVLC
jgi:cyclin A